MLGYLLAKKGLIIDIFTSYFVISFYHNMFLRETIF